MSIENIPLGCDIESSWLFKDGDLILVDNLDNLIQAINNRLNLYLHTLQIYYTNYGSLIKDYLGESNTEIIREHIKLEIENSLKNDPRILNLNVTTIKLEYNSVKAEIIITMKNGEVLEYNMVITGDRHNEL